MAPGGHEGFRSDQNLEGERGLRKVLSHGREMSWFGRRFRRRSGRRTRRQHSTRRNNICQLAIAIGGRERSTLDCADVMRAWLGDLDGALSGSTQGDNSICLLGSLKTGRLGESPVNLSMTLKKNAEKGTGNGSLVDPRRIDQGLEK